MAEPLKNIYNKDFFDQLLNSLQTLIPEFDSKSFGKAIYDSEWEGRALKERMRHITVVLKEHLSEDYKTNVKTLVKLIPVLIKNGFKPDSLEFIFLPDFIEVYGLKYFDVSVKAIEKITQFVTCEFAVRPFILKYQDKMVKQMLLWSDHKHPMVRRLSTEGCRPRLPWAMAIPAFKENPKYILPILEKLKKDDSESVRRSVANNLNDISKDNPETLLKILKKWKGKNAETDKLLKHACRTLLKQGNTKVMESFGFGSIDKIKVSDLKVLTLVVKIGAFVEFSFDLSNTDKTASKIRLEYGLYYQKANGTLSRKVFKISEKEYPGKSTTTILKKQSFKVITTRKFHIGKHQVSIIVNGREFEKVDFELKK